MSRPCQVHGFYVTGPWQLEGVEFQINGRRIADDSRLNLVAGSGIRISGVENNDRADITLQSMWLAMQTMVLLGDSITNACFNTAASVNGSASSLGYWTWAQHMLQHRFQLLAYYSQGGLRSDELITGANAKLAAAVAAAPGYCLVEAGINDCAQMDGATVKDLSGNVITAATIEANLLTIYTQLRNAGITVVATTITPSTSINNSTKKTCLHDVNQWIRNYARVTPGVILCDWYPTMADPTSGDPLAGLTTDGVHPSHLGAYVMGQELAKTLQTASVPMSALPYSNADPRKLLPNPRMVGAAPGTSVTFGTINVAAVTAVQSIIPRTDGVQGQWQQANASVANDGWAFSQSNTNVGTDWNIGDTIFAAAEVELEAGGSFSPWTGAIPFRLSLLCNGPGAQEIWDNHTQSSYGAFSGLYPTGRQVFRTPNIVVPAASTGLFVRAQSGLLNAAVRVGRMEIYKVTAGQPGGL